MSRYGRAASATDRICSNVPTALAISPHLDDAVFSAGGTLTRLAREGWRVVVATVFSASVPEPAGFALACQLDKGLPPDLDYMALRRNEDAVACAAIGAEPFWMPFREAPHRGYDSAAALFAARRADDDVVAEIAPTIARLIDDLRPDLVLTPQAVGAHVDHVAVFDAVRGVAIPIRFWRDFPYAVRTPCPGSPFGAELDLLPQSVTTLSAADIAIKRQAVAAYASQLAFQFGGLARAEAIVADEGASECFALRG